MSGYTYSLVIIVPDADKPDAVKMAQAMGHCPSDSDTYTVPLSADGTGTPTHWLGHSWCTPGFAAMLSAVGEGVLPEPEAGGAWEDYGLTEARVLEIMSAAVFSCIEGADPVTHVNDVLSAKVLQKCS